MGSQQLYSLSWGEFGASFASTVQVLRGQHEMVDVTLTAGGKIFPAHKLVLSAASPLLMELLKSTHCHHPVLMLAGITAQDLEALLQFVYQGEVSVVPSQLPSLLQAAHCLNIQALSPQTISAEKTLTQISIPVVMAEPSREVNAAGPMSRDAQSPVLPVRKRRRRHHRDSEGGGTDDGSTEDHPQVMTLDPLNHPQMAHVQVANNLKHEGPDEQQHHCNGEQSAETKRLVSDLPVECTVCGVTLRQSRNLKRHMELIHLKAEGGKQRKIPHTKDENKPEEEMGVQSVHTLTEMSPLDVVVVEQGGTRQPQPNMPLQQHASTSTQHLVSTTSLLVASTSQSSSQLAPSSQPQSQLVVASAHLAHATSQQLYHSNPYTHAHVQTQAHSHAQTHMQFTHDTAHVFRQQQQHQTEQHLMRGAGMYEDTREHCSTD